MARYILFVVNNSGQRVPEYNRFDTSKRILEEKRNELKKELKREYPKERLTIKIKKCQ